MLRRIGSILKDTTITTTAVIGVCSSAAANGGSGIHFMNNSNVLYSAFSHRSLCTTHSLRYPIVTGGTHAGAHAGGASSNRGGGGGGVPPRSRPAKDGKSRKPMFRSTFSKSPSDPTKSQPTEGFNNKSSSSSSRNSRSSSSSVKKKMEVPRTSGAAWSLADVDAEGMTDLDRRYEADYERIKIAMSRSVDIQRKHNEYNQPDFLIGLGQYIFRLRDQYRHALVQALQAAYVGDASPPPLENVTQIDLSVGWRGHFDLASMPNVGVHKVLGVTLRAPSETSISDAESLGLSPDDTTSDPFLKALEMDPEAEKEEDAKDHGKGGKTQHQQSPPRLQLPSAEKDVLVSNVVEMINSRRVEGLVNLNIISAILPSQSVVSEETKPEVNDLVAVIRDLVKLSKAVVFYRSPAALAEEAIRSPPKLMHSELDLSVEGFAAELAVNKTKWEKFFFRHQTLPRAINIDDFFGESHSMRTVLNAFRVACAGAEEFPAVFINGNYSGTIRQLAYLSQHKVLGKGLLHHPHTISSKEERTQGPRKRERLSTLT